MCALDLRRSRSADRLRETGSDLKKAGSDVGIFSKTIASVSTMAPISTIPTDLIYVGHPPVVQFDSVGAGVPTNANEGQN